MHQNEYRFWMATVIGWALFTFAFTADRVNWLLDAGWVVVGLPILMWSRRSFPLTPLLYRLLAIHAVVLIAGGFWTYEKNPLGLWLQDLFGTQRNHYDRFGHFMQGFVPAILFREIYARCSPVMHAGWLSYFAFLSCMTFSALFELLEWGATLIAGAGGDEFLGHQGDVWDAQWDMLWALIGSVMSLLLLSTYHSKQLRIINWVRARSDQET